MVLEARSRHIVQHLPLARQSSGLSGRKYQNPWRNTTAERHLQTWGSAAMFVPIHRSQQRTQRCTPAHSRRGCPCLLSQLQLPGNAVSTFVDAPLFQRAGVEQYQLPLIVELILLCDPRYRHIAVPSGYGARGLDEYRRIRRCRPAGFLDCSYQ